MKGNAGRRNAAGFFLRPNKEKKLADENKHEATEEAVIPVVEERVAVEKRTIEGRTVTVTTHPTVKRQDISEPVMREKVTVERVPVGEVVDAVPDIREDGDLTVIPVVEERLVVTRELVLKEEIHLRRKREEVIDEQTVELRGTDVEITD